jgi:hypothetical protein
MITVSNLFVKKDKNGNPVKKHVNLIPKSDDIRVIKYNKDGNTEYKLSIRDWGYNTYSLLDNGLDDEIFINLDLDGCEYEINSLEKTIGFEQTNEYDLARSKEYTDYCSNMLINIENTLNEKVNQKTLKR